MVKTDLQCRKPGFDPWGQEDPLEKEMATHSVYMPGEFHGQSRVTGRPWGRKELGMTEKLFHFYFMRMKI